MDPKTSDVLIIGGGPAGMSAAIWCADLGLTASIFETQNELGGQLLYTFNAISNYPGVKTSGGRQLCDLFVEHLDHNNIRRFIDAEITAADLARKTVTLADGRSAAGQAIIIATGVRRRRLEIPGEAAFVGRGILESGVGSSDEVRGKTVVIVGGGDAALENGLILSETAKRVFVIHRGKEFSARSSFVRQAAHRENIGFLFETSITSLIGESTLEAIEISCNEDGKAASLRTDHVLIRIGSIPNTELFKGQIDLGIDGYVAVDQRCRTQVEDVWAAGDVVSPLSPTISNAAGQAARAVMDIRKILLS